MERHGVNHLFVHKSETVQIDTFSRRFLKEFEETKREEETFLSFCLLLFVNKLHLEGTEGNSRWTP